MIRRRGPVDPGYKTPVIPPGRDTDRIFDHFEDFRRGRATPVLLLVGLLVGLVVALVVAVWLVLAII